MTCQKPTAFNARALYVFKSDVLYRVYVRPEELYFIRIGGQGLGGGVAGGLGAFGLIGALLGGFFETLLKKQNAKRLMAIQSELDANDPLSLLQANQGSFVQNVSQIATSSLEPRGLLTSHGEQLGRWLIKLHDGGSTRLQFETGEDLAAALQLLPTALGSKLAVNVAWNPARQRYQKRHVYAG